MIKLTRKRLSNVALLLVLLLAVTFTFFGCSTNSSSQSSSQTSTEISTQKTEETVYTRPEVTSSLEAKKLLEDGNQRFMQGNLLKKDIGSTKREELSKGQKPFAIVVSCSDSRVPPELLFDQALGDLFVIRVAGNVVDPVAMGSIEYAVEHLKAPYLIVMGHEKCGAVKATVEGGEAPGSIGSIVAKIKPSVDKAKVTGVTGEELVEKSVDENVRAVITTIEKSHIIKEALESGKLAIDGTKYHLDSGKVDWFAAKK